jgi:hypothetical protein
MNSTEAVERARAVIRRQHKTIATEQTYLHWLRHYMLALGQMPALLSSEQKLERFLSDLALRKNVSASTQNQAFNAIVFFYKDGTGQAAERGGRVAREPARAGVPGADGCGNARFTGRSAERGRLPHPPGGPAALRVRIAGQ